MSQLLNLLFLIVMVGIGIAAIPYVFSLIVLIMGFLFTVVLPTILVGFILYAIYQAITKKGS